MAEFTTNFLYLLDQSGQSENGKVVRELVPFSTATSTEAINDSTLMFGEDFTSVFTDEGVSALYGDFAFTYIGHDPAFPESIVAQDEFGNFYLFSNEVVPIGTNMNGIEEEEFVICFLAGTMIRCPDGERAVETLAIGDLILTVDGRAVPVMWIGRQTIATLFGPPEGRRPVCITAGALGDNLPARDLRVTSDHALFIDGVLVQAGALVNGSTIRRISLAELGQRYMTYHIETEKHELLLAEGMAAESFVDNVPRRLFNNHAEFVALYDEDRVIAELDYPRAMSARQVPQSIRNRIVSRDAALQASSPHGASYSSYS